MANFFDVFKQKTTKKIFPVIFAIDASGSMDGKRISHLNNAIRNIVKNFVIYNSKEENDFNIRTAILKFSSGTQWITDGLVDPTDINFSGISCGGVTDLGSALNELDQKLSRREFFVTTNSYVAPFICFVTDGMPTDDYGVSLEKLNGNNWYKVAKKVAVAIGDTVDFNVLNEVVGSSEAIVRLNTEALLEQILIGLCTTLFTSSVSVSTVAQPVRPITRTEFDSDHVCYSRLDSQPIEFDSDHFGVTCVLNETAKNEFDDEETIGSLCNKMPNLMQRVGKFSACYEPIDSNSLSDMAKEERKKLAEALRNGEAPGFQIPKSVNSEAPNSSFGIQIQVPDGKLAGGNICPSCGNVVMTGHKFCSGCGTPVQQIASPKVNVSQVQFSAIVPKRFTKGDYAMINIAVYEELYRNIVDRVIANADDEVKEVVASSQEIVDNTVIRINLSSPDIELTDCDETQKWQGKYLTFSFPLEIPNNYAKKQILFIANVYFNDVIATKLKFIANCSSAREQKIQLTREDVLTAFISYASQDRSRVATIIQGMQKARPDMDIFFDVESLRSGDDWESALRREIEKRDILFLCWSNYARTSEWVEKEWRYALLNKGIDAIEPVPLVSPVECPPPEELKSKHFNDRALLYREL